MSHSSILYIKVGQYELEEEIPIEITSKKDDASKSGSKQGSADKLQEDKREDDAFPNEDEEDENMQTVIRLVDEDQQGKVLSVQGMGIPNLSNQTVWSINQYGAKAYREAFLEQIRESYGEFFEDNKDYDDILESTNKTAESDI